MVTTESWTSTARRASRNWLAMRRTDCCQLCCVRAGRDALQLPTRAACNARPFEITPSKTTRGDEANGATSRGIRAWNRHRSGRVVPHVERRSNVRGKQSWEGWNVASDELPGAYMATGACMRLRSGRSPRSCTVTWRNAVRVPHALAPPAARCPTCERTILRLSTLMWAAVRHTDAVAEAEAGRTRPLKEHCHWQSTGGAAEPSEPARPLSCAAQGGVLGARYLCTARRRPSHRRSSWHMSGSLALQSAAPRSAPCEARLTALAGPLPFKAWGHCYQHFACAVLRAHSTHGRRGRGGKCACCATALRRLADWVCA